MGNEIKRDTCPEKYCNQKNTFTGIIPVIISLLIVCVFSGVMLKQGGLNIVITVVVEAVVLCLFSVLYYFLFKKSRARLADTYISVCDNGVHGECAANGFKNKTFELSYAEISNVAVRGDRLSLYSSKGTVFLFLKDVNATAELINQKRAGTAE